MQNTKRKIANAQLRYLATVAQMQQCKADMLTGGSYVLYKMAVAEADAALVRLQTLQAQAVEAV